MTMGILWELRQQRKIGQADAAASSAAAGVTKAGETIRKVEQRVDGLTDVCEALWSLLKEQTGLSDDALLERITEISRHRDLGGAASKADLCPKCGRPIQTNNDRCLYCGESLGCS